MHLLVFQVHVLVQLALADLLAAATLMATTLLSKYDIERSVKLCPFGLPLALVRRLLISSLCKIVFLFPSFFPQMCFKAF